MVGNPSVVPRSIDPALPMNVAKIADRAHPVLRRQLNELIEQAQRREVTNMAASRVLTTCGRLGY
jgi:hypothetical protein